MTVGEKIKQRRLELNMSQEELAKKCGYKSRSSINKIELSRDLPLKKAKLMANALDLTIAYLMGWETESSDFAKSIEEGMDQHPDDATLAYLYAGILQDKIVTNLTEAEWDLISTFRTLDEESRRMVAEMITFLKSKKQEN